MEYRYGGDILYQPHLQALNSYQLRVAASLEKLSLPDWYTAAPPPAPPSAPPTPKLPSSSSTPSSLASSWRCAASQSGWRRQCSGSSSSTLERAASASASSQRHKSRVSSLASAPSSQQPPALARPLYLGWRSQERLDIGPAYLTTPAQRLASTAVDVKLRKEKTDTSAKCSGDVESDIKEVTSAIMDFCKSSLSDKPEKRVNGWVDSSKEMRSEDTDGDSAIEEGEASQEEFNGNGIIVSNGRSLYSF